MPEFVPSLSIAGKDGTTRRRFLNPIIENKVRIKTGTLNDVSSAGGYVFGQSGEVFSFALITNYPRVERVLGPKFQEALVEDYPTIARTARRSRIVYGSIHPIKDI